MARISGVNIPTNKKVNIALTYIFGIGNKVAGDICSEASVDITKRVSELNDNELNLILTSHNIHNEDGAFESLCLELLGSRSFEYDWAENRGIIPNNSRRQETGIWILVASFASTLFEE